MELNNLDLSKPIKASELQNQSVLMDIRIATDKTKGEVEPIFIENDMGIPPGEVFDLYISGLRMANNGENSELKEAWLNNPENQDGDSVFLMPAFESSHENPSRGFIKDILAGPEKDPLGRFKENPLNSLSSLDYLSSLGSLNPLASPSKPSPLGAYFKTFMKEIAPTPDANPFARLILAGEEYSIRDGSKWDPNSDEYRKEFAESEKFYNRNLLAIQRARNYLRITSEPDGELSPYVRQGYPIEDNKGNIIQEGAGDCWLLAILLSLRETPRGREILDKILDKNPDGSVTVNFLGSGDSYTISAEEIENGNLVKQRLSSGDPDYKAIEIATARHIEKLMKKLGDAPSADHETRYRQHQYLNGEPLGGGYLDSQIVRDLIGEETDTGYVSENNLNLAAKAIKFKDASAVFFHTPPLKISDLENPQGSFIPVPPDGIDLHTKHAYALDSINPEARTVILRDPHNGAEEIKLTYDQFLKFFEKIEIAYLSKPDLRGQTPEALVNDSFERRPMHALSEEQFFAILNYIFNHPIEDEEQNNRPLISFTNDLDL